MKTFRRSIIQIFFIFVKVCVKSRFFKLSLKIQLLLEERCRYRYRSSPFSFILFLSFSFATIHQRPYSPWPFSQYITIRHRFFVLFIKNHKNWIKLKVVLTEWWWIVKRVLVCHEPWERSGMVCTLMDAHERKTTERNEDED